MKFKSDYTVFQHDIAVRGITHLCHFTRFESITAIVGEGKILPRSRLHNVGYDWRELVMLNSPNRFDNPKDLNTSIMHPNIYLLNVFKNKWYPGSRFCVIGIDPKYIYENKTTFAISNASYGTTKSFGIYGNINGFRALFNNKVVGGSNKAKRVTIRGANWPLYYTTDFEAEVLIECEIPYEDLLFIALKDQFDYNILASVFDTLDLPEEKFCVEPTLFESREYI